MIRALQSVHQWRRQAAAGFGAQLTHGAAAIGIVLVAQRATGSFTDAGIVAGLFGVANAVARPVQGRLIDRGGASRIMAICGAAHASALIGLAAVGTTGGPLWALLGCAVLAGVAVPPVSQSMRVSWGQVASEADRMAAFSMVTLTQEVAILTGPLMFSAIMLLSQSAPIALSAVAIASGVSALALAAMSRSPRPRVSHSPPARVMTMPGMPSALGIGVLLGVTLGAIELAAPALAVAEGQPAATGTLIAAVSVGGVVGAVILNVIGSNATPNNWLIVLMGLLTLAVAPLTLTDSLVLAGLVLLAAGLPINPALTALALVVNDLAPARAGEAFGWLSTALAVGTTVGTAIAGFAAEHLGGAAPAFLIGTGGAFAGTLLAALARPALSGPSSRSPDSRASRGPACQSPGPAN